MSEPKWFEGKQNRYEVIEEDDGGIQVVGHRPDGSTFLAARQSPVIAIPVTLRVSYATYSDGSTEIIEVEEHPATE